MKTRGTIYTNKLNITALIYVAKLIIIAWSLSIFETSQAASTAYPLKSNNSINNSTNDSDEDTNKAIIIVNGQPAISYLLKSLKNQGFTLVNLITPSSTLKITREDMLKAENYYDSVISIQNSESETLEPLKRLFQSKGYSFSEVLVTQQIDAELADIIREFFKKPSNGEKFRSLNRDKTVATNQLNEVLQTRVDTQVVTIEDFAKAVLKQALPCSVKVINSQETLATYVIAKTSDIEPTLARLQTYKSSDIKFWLQPYYENLYRLQVTSFNNKTSIASLWLEKSSTKEGQAVEDMRALIDLKEPKVIAHNKLAQIAQQLTEALHLSYGIGEFILALDKNQVSVLDYNLTIPNSNQIEVMDEILGYNTLLRHLTGSPLITEVPATKKFKNIIAVNLSLNDKNHLQQLSVLPTFYKYYADQDDAESASSNGELYLMHTNKDLVTASYFSIRNMERILLNPQFSSHSTIHIADFYREAAANKKTDYTLSKEAEEQQSADQRETLKNLQHDREHIPKYVKPLGAKATIQDIMRYYIDIYDLYYLHGKPLGTKAIPMNTGNPAFLPFPPIVKALDKSLKEGLLSYARYNFQIPEISFVNKITQYCQEEQFLAPQRKLQPNNVVIGHGSTNLYYLALKSIIKNKGDIVLITRPTYGLFIDPIYTAEGDVGFIDIKEDMSWKVQPENLQETIIFYNQKAFYNYILTTFIKDYNKLLHAQKVFNLKEGSIPPIPNIEAITNLKSFDDYIAQLNTYIDNISDPVVNKDELKFSYSPRVRAFYHINPHNPTGAVYTQEDLAAIAKVIQAYPDIYVIDDLAHWGVVFDAVKPATFSSLDYMFGKTLTLMSLSKAYCVPGLRAGIAIGDADIISEMQYRLLNSSSSATLPAIIALNSVIDTPKIERDQYLKSNSQEYFYRRNLMGTLINGIHKTDMSFEQKIKVYQLILENEYKEGKAVDKKFLKLMLSGMPLVRTLTEPKGCFFHLLDISRLIGAKIGHTTLQTATDVRNAIYSICNIDMVPGEISGNFFNYSLRMSFSLNPQQIYNACKNIHLFIVTYIIKHNPDILAKWYTDDGRATKLFETEVVDESILNKALTRLYLSKAIQSIQAKHAQLSSSNNIQNKSKLQELKKIETELNLLSEKLLDPSSDKTINKEIYGFIKQNEKLLRNHLHDIEQLKAVNQTASNFLINEQIFLKISKDSPKLIS